MEINLIHNMTLTKFYTDEIGSFDVKGFKISQFVPDEFNSLSGVTTYGLSNSIFTTDVEGNQIPEFSVYSLKNFQPGGVAGLGLPGDSPFTLDELKLDMKSWNVDGFNIDDFTNFGDNALDIQKELIILESLS